MIEVSRKLMKKTGRTRVTLEISGNECVRVFDLNKLYKLGGQMDDIVLGHVLAGSSGINWDHLSQNWEHRHE